MLARPRSQRKTCATIFAPIGPGVSYHEPAVAADTYADGGRCAVVVQLYGAVYAL